MTKKEDTIISYNRGAKGLAEKFDKIGQRVGDIELGLSYVSEKDPEILELGCGNGRDAQAILQYSKKYLGVDVSVEMIKLARQNNPEGNFLIADIENFDFPQNIDIIFAFASLLHFDKESLKNIFDKIYNSLNPEGVLYVSLKYDEYQEKIKKDEFGPRVFFTYTVKDIQELLGDKFQLIREDYQTKFGVDWMTLVLKRNI